jgi:hypothetical protein
VYGHAHRAEDSGDWTELPLLVAVDIWRDEVKRWPLESLLASEGSHPTPLEQIQTGIESRLVASDDIPRSREAAEQMRDQQVLRRRGIRILGVQIANLKVPEAVRQEHLRRWREEWGSAIEEGVLEARGRGQETRWEGEQAGQQALLELLVSATNTSLDHQRNLSRRDTLLSLLAAAEEALQSPESLAESGALVAHLHQMRDEIRQLGPDCRQEGA